MFKIKNQKQFEALLKQMKEDISVEAIEKMRWELLSEKPYYTNVGDELKYDDDTSTIFSDSWAPAIINQGREPGSYVPVQILVNWVLKYKNPGATPQEAMAIAKRVNNKIYSEGIDPKWFVDNALFDMETEHE